MLSIAKSTVYKLVDRGEIEAVHLPGLSEKRIPHSAYAEFVKRSTRATRRP